MGLEREASLWRMLVLPDWMSQACCCCVFALSYTNVLLPLLTPRKYICIPLPSLNDQKQAPPSTCLCSSYRVRFTGLCSTPTSTLSPPVFTPHSAQHASCLVVLSEGEAGRL